MNLLTERIELKAVKEAKVEEVRNYLLKNEAFLAEWEPIRGDDYYSEETIRKDLENKRCEMEQGKALHYFIYLNSNSKLIGTISLSNIVRGAFLSCFLGYKLDYEYLNKGLMTEALELVIKKGFTELSLHRIEANAMPRNIRSKRVLEKSGFMNEGISRKYLKINGKWEDHEHFVLLNSELE